MSQYSEQRTAQTRVRLLRFPTIVRYDVKLASPQIHHRFSAGALARTPSHLELIQPKHSNMTDTFEDTRYRLPVVFLIYGPGDIPKECVLTTPEEVRKHDQDPRTLNTWIESQKTVIQTYTAYKRVDQKVKPIPAVFPSDAGVIWQFPSNPLDSLQPLPTNPPEFTLSAKINHERLEILAVNNKGYLWPEEEKLFKYIMKTNEGALAFEDSERGTLREDYFTPYIMPVVPHIPWAHGNIPITIPEVRRKNCYWQESGADSSRGYRHMPKLWEFSQY